MQVGNKLRLLRGNMTQAELAGRSGIDKAIISKIESGKMLGTVECHSKLAEVFGLKLSEFYACMEEDKMPPVEFYPAANNKMETYQEFLGIITSVPLSKKMLPAFITLAPKEERFLEETIKKVERFIIILEGEIEIQVEDSCYYLKKEFPRSNGDSIYSLSSCRHRIKNSGQATAQILCVSAPPAL